MAAIFTRSFFCICFFIFFFFSACFSQFSIYGRVEDQVKHTPIPDADVFFNYTTIATNTDQQGSFSFSNLRLTNVDIVVSSPGYESLAFRPTTENLNGKNIVFRLRKKILQERKLLVDFQSRKIAIDLFKQLLLGQTEEAEKCKIINSGAFYFLKGDNDGQFRMKANSAVVIINEKLSYKINYYLDSAQFDYSANKSNIYGFVRYQELGSNKRTVANRKKIYNGSTLHFFRSLVNHQSYQQSFELFMMLSSDSNSLHEASSNILIAAQDTALWKPVAADILLNIDSLNELSINVKGKVLVYYSRNPDTKYDLAKINLNDGLLAKGVQSYIVFTNSPIKINYMGILDDYSSVKYYGYWSNELLANKLPLDYESGN